MQGGGWASSLAASGGQSPCLEAVGERLRDFLFAMSHQRMPQATMGAAFVVQSFVQPVIVLAFGMDALHVLCPTSPDAEGYRRSTDQ
jgi:hypothetical protein